MKTKAKNVHRPQEHLPKVQFQDFNFEPTPKTLFLAFRHFCIFVSCLFIALSKSPHYSYIILI